VSGSGLNFKGIIFWVIILAIIALAVFYFTNTFHFKDHITNFVATLKLPQLPDIGGVFQWIQANPLATTVFGFLGTTAVGYVIKNWQTNKTLDKMTTELATSKADLSAIEKTYEAKLVDQQKQIDLLNSDTTAESLQQRIGPLNNEITQLKAQLQSALSQNQDLMNRIENTPVKIVKVVG